MGILSAAEKAALKIEAEAAEKVAAKAAIKGGYTRAEHRILNEEAARLRKMGARKTTAPGRAARSEARRLRALPPPPKVRTGWNKRAYDASQWVKGHKKIVAGAGAVAIAGTAISNASGPGSPKGTPVQARGIYGF
jgi:hypothetical protein